MIKYIAGLMLALSISVAQAEVNSLVATAPNGAVVELTQEVGVCQYGAKIAKYLSPDRKTTLDGCWKISDSAPVISIGWFDGEGSAIPAKVFKPKETL